MKEIRQFNWPALMRVGLNELKLTPGSFWDLTPVELMIMAGRDMSNANSLDRDGLEALMKRFPDERKEEEK